MIILLTSCFEDYVKDYEYTGIYFPYQVNVRTFVVGEGMQIKVGVALGGVIENDRRRIVNYRLDDSYITDDVFDKMLKGESYIQNSIDTSLFKAFRLLPQHYYTVSDAGTFVIEKGFHTGTITIKADSAAFLADRMTLYAQYVLPFVITQADADSIIDAKKYAVIGLKYEHMLFGNYYHGGITTVKNDLTG